MQRLLIYLFAALFSATVCAGLPGGNVTLNGSFDGVCNNAIVERPAFRTDGNIVVCPDGYTLGTIAELPTVAIAGYKGVTQARDALGAGIRVDIGGGNNDHADFTTFDPGTLTPGSVVNVYHRGTPYNSKMMLHKSGTITQPIILNGVTDASGNRPQFDFDGASMINPSDSGTTLAALGGIVIGYPRDTGSFGDTVEYVEIHNIEVFNARGDYTNGDSGSAYLDGAAGIRIQEGNYITIAGSVIRDNGNGIFVHSGTANKSIRIAGNYIHSNGQVGRYLEHNVYMQAVADTPFTNIVEGNVFGPLTAGSFGTSSLKHRGTDLIFRYNTVVSNARPLDLVEAQDSLPNWIYDNLTAQEIQDRYRTAYAYGNVFISQQSSGAYDAFGLHFGWDSGSAHPTDGELFNESGAPYGLPLSRSAGGNFYVYHNTFYKSVTNQGTSSLIDLGGSGDTPSTYPGTVHLANNAFHFKDEVGSGDLIAHLKETGTAVYEGSNYIFIETAGTTTLYEGHNEVDDPDITIVNPGNITQSATVSIDYEDPTPANFLDSDFRLKPTSPARNAAGSLTAAMQVYPVEMQPALPSSGGTLTRNNFNHLGAFE